MHRSATEREALDDLGEVVQLDGHGPRRRLPPRWQHDETRAPHRERGDGPRVLADRPRDGDRAVRLEQLTA